MTLVKLMPMWLGKVGRHLTVGLSWVIGVDVVPLMMSMVRGPLTVMMLTLMIL